MVIEKWELQDSCSPLRVHTLEGHSQRKRPRGVGHVSQLITVRCPNRQKEKKEKMPKSSLIMYTYVHKENRIT